MKEDSNSISIIDYSNFGQIWSLQISRPILEPFWREPNIFASMEFKKLGCFIHGVKVIFHDHMTIQNLKSSMSQYTIYITCTWYWNIELNQSMAWPCMKMIKEREKNKQILAPTRLLPPKLVSWTTLSTSIYATKSCAHLSHHISYISQLHKKCMFFDKSNINSIICFGDFIYQSPAQLCEGEYID